MYSFFLYILSAIFCIHFYYLYQYRHFKGPFALPLVGNLYDLKTLSIIHYIHSCVENYGSIFLFWVGYKPMVVICDPIVVRKVLTDTKTFVKGPDYTDKFSVVFGQGLVTSNGNKHKEDRTCLGRFFTKTNLSIYHKMICETTDKMIEEELMPNVGKVVDIQTFFHILSLRIFGMFSMGVDYSLPENKSIAKKINDGVKKGSSIVGKHIIFQIPMIALITSVRQVKKIVRFVDEHISHIIDCRLMTHEDRDDLLGALLEKYGKTKKNDKYDESIHDHIRTALAAGHDTTAFFGCYMAYLLANHPEVQINIRRELDKYGVNGNMILEEQHLTKLSYCRCALQEVLRMYTIIPFVNRTNVKPYVIEGKVVPANTTILVPLSVMNRSKTIWENPNTFCPERFIHIQGHNNAQKGYLPFGYGTRSCIGANLAMTEGMIMLIKLVSRFRLYPKAGFKPSIIAGISLISKNGIQVILEEM